MAAPGDQLMMTRFNYHGDVIDEADQCFYGGVNMSHWYFIIQEQ